MVATNAPHRTDLCVKAYKGLKPAYGLKGLYERIGTTTLCTGYHMDHKLALCWDLLDRFVHTEGNIWEWIIRGEAYCDLGLMSALHNHTHTYVQDDKLPQGHAAYSAALDIAENIEKIQHMKGAQYTVQDQTMATPIARLKLCYALLAKYAVPDHLAAYIRQVRNLSRPLAEKDNEPVFEIRQGNMIGARDFLKNDYITTMKGALVLHNAFRTSNTINVTIGAREDYSTSAFCFLVDQQCPVNNVKTAQGDVANVRIFTHDVTPGWLEYILVATKPIKKVTAPTWTHTYTERRQQRFMN